ncbi:MAG: CoA transferase [Rhodobacteraceae bacterium]|nr:CoA transferase [Paracoccaceae bacterium]
MSELLKGVRVVEFAGQGPAPFCAMMLADHGAQIIRIERAQGIATLNIGNDPMRRKRHTLTLNLKDARAQAVALDIIAESHVLIEGHRPGVMERLGLGPDVCLTRQPALIYGRVTGWGQTGPLSHTPGRDINYIGLSGALAAIGSERPTPPLNLVGDFGGGGMLLAFGILAALWQAEQTGTGSIIDAAMIDGAAIQMTSVMGLFANHQWRNQRSSNLLDGGAPFYRTYKCLDHRWIAVGALDRRSITALLKMTELADEFNSVIEDQAQWKALEDRLEALFKTRHRDDWALHPEASTACVTPVLTIDEAPQHPHNRVRNVFTRQGNGQIPSAAPRVSGIQKNARSDEMEYVQDSNILLKLLNWPEERIQTLKAAGICL